MDSEEEEELRELLAERDRYIDELEAELSAQEQDNDKQRDELLQCQDKIAELKVEAKQLRQDNQDLAGENAQLEDETKAQKSQLDVSRSEITRLLTSSEDAKRLQKDGNQQLHRLELENERLRATVHEIEENEDILVNEIDTLVRENSKYKEQNEDLSSKCDSLYADLDEKARANSQLMKGKEKVQNDLEAEQLAYSKDTEEWQRKDAASRSEITRLLTELEQERAKHKELAHIKENEAFRKELAKIRRENKRLHSSHDRCLRDKNQAERDLDSAIQALNEAKRNAREEIASVERKQRISLNDAKSKVDAAQQKEGTLRTRCLDVEDQLEDLRKQLERSEERNSSYEQNHGLTEVVRCQKILEADLRRRDSDLKRLNHTLGVEIEKVRALNKACNWLKKKAKVGPDFMFDDDEIKEVLESEDNRLLSENLELSRQIESLEAERTKLLAQLRERAIDIGDRGVRFLGMSSHQVSQVMEFASNLRNGKIELPLNDRSKELLTEVSNLKSARDVDKVTIERLKREVFSAAAAKEPHGESLLLKQMAAEHQKLRDEIDALKVHESKDPKNSALTHLMRERARDLLGEDLVPMSAAAEVQFLCLMSEHDKVIQELALLTKNLPIQIDKDNARGSTHYIRADARRASSKNDVANGCNEKSADTVVSNMEKAMEDLKNERDILSAQLSHLASGDEPGQVMGLISEVTRLSDDLLKEKSARSNAQRVLAEIRATYKDRLGLTSNMTGCEKEKTAELFSILQCNQKLGDGSVKDFAAQDEIKNINESLLETKKMLSGYIDNMTELRSSIFAMQENRIDSATVSMQISCLNDVIREKNCVLRDTKHKLAAAKQINLELSRTKGFHEHQKNSDRSLSTHSIDRSILRATNNSGCNTPTRNHLENATRLVFEKESIIIDQNSTIVELNDKLVSADEAYQQLLKEADNMKTDISNLVARFTEAESDVRAIDAYQKKCDEIETFLEDSKKEARTLRSKLSALTKERAEKDAKIKELKETVIRTKRILTVARQGRSRSEQSLKASNEEILALKEQLKNVGSQMNTLKKEKIEAQNEKIKLSRKARLSANKVKNLTDRKEDKTVEELEKRVSVLNKTVSGLASQNSKLRGELAAHKLLKKKVDEEAMASPPMKARCGSTSRERPTIARNKSLEQQVKSLQRSLSEEKKHANESSSMLDRYQKRIHALEQALESTASHKSGDGVDDSMPEHSDSNTEVLQQQISSLTKENTSLKQKIPPPDQMESLIKRLKIDNDALKKENERLSQVDHLDFFEEIEDLKYKYNEAVRQINQLTTG